MKTLAPILLAIFFSAAILAQDNDTDFVPVPETDSYVTDLPDQIPASDEKFLNDYMSVVNKKLGSQIVVLIVPTTKPETIEGYAIKVFDQWKIGRKGVDDGILILVATEDKKARIEVGRGLEGAITDIQARKLLDDVLIPEIKKGQMAKGLALLGLAIHKQISKEDLPTPEEYKAQMMKKQGPAYGTWTVMFLLNFPAIIWAMKRKYYPRFNKVILILTLIFWIPLYAISTSMFAISESISIWILLGGFLLLLWNIINFFLVWRRYDWAKSLSSSGGSSSGNSSSYRRERESTEAYSDDSTVEEDDNKFEGGGGESAGGGASSSW